MDPLTIATGVSIGGRLLGGLFGGKGEIPEPAWGAQRTYFEHQLRKMLRPQREEALSSLRLEASRGGGLSGGAYLSGVVDIQKRFQDIMGRELGAYEMQQATARQQWSMQRAMTQYQQPSRLGQTLEGISGDVAGYFGTQALGQKRAEYFSQMSSKESLSDKISILSLIKDESMKRKLLEAWSGELGLPKTIFE